MDAEYFADPIYGHLPEEWSLTTIGQLVAKGEADIQTGPFGTMLHAKSYVSAGTPVVAVQHIGENRLLHKDLPRVGPEDRARLARYALLEGDIVFGRKGAIDRRAYVTSSETGWLQGSDCIRVRFASETVDPRFVSYVLGSRVYREWISRNAQGATMPSLNQEIIRRIPLPLPPFREQQAIADILGALDDKIEVNRRMNQTLEAMSRAIFKAWFVDFEPVRAKMEGRWRRGESLPGLPAHLYDLFPDRLVDSELGEIPEGWEVGTIGDLADVVGGSTPSTKERAYWEGGIHYWATPKDLSGLRAPVLLETERKITDAGLAQISSGLLPRGTVLLSSRAPIGYLAIAEVPVAINQGFIAMKPRKGVSNLFLLLWATFAHDDILSRANGSTFQEISKASFRPIPAALPPAAIMQAFDDQIHPLYERIINNERESRTLLALRDALLPKLIRGEIRVKDAEGLVLQSVPNLNFMKGGLAND